MARVLIAEDDFFERENLAAACRGLGIEVVEASNGINALILAEQHGTRIDAVLVDYQMPHEVTGAHVIAQLRTVHPSLPMFLATGMPSVVSKDWLSKHRVSVLPKPYNADAAACLILDAICNLSTRDRRPLAPEPPT